MSAPVHRSSGFEDAGFVLMADILAPDDGSAIQQADLSSITYKVFDMSDASEVATGTLNITNVISDTYVTTDPRWSAGGNGYNFIWSPPATVVPQPDRTYQLEVLFTPSSGEQFFAVWQRAISALYTS